MTRLLCSDGGRNPERDHSEPLFLLVAALGFLAGTGRSRIVFSAGIVLVRVTGVAFAAATLARAYRERGTARRTLLLAIVASGVALAAWVVAVGVITRDPLGFVHDGSASWATVSGIRALAQAIRHPTPTYVLRIAFVALLALGAALVLRRDLELGTFAVVTLGMMLLPGSFVGSYARYALVAFPAFAGVAGRLGRNGSLVLALIFAAAQVVIVRQTFLTTIPP